MIRYRVHRSHRAPTAKSVDLARGVRSFFFVCFRALFLSTAVKKVLLQKSRTLCFRKALADQMFSEKHLIVRQWPQNLPAFWEKSRVLPKGGRTLYICCESQRAFCYWVVDGCTIPSPRFVFETKQKRPWDKVWVFFFAVYSERVNNIGQIR